MEEEAYHFFDLPEAPTNNNKEEDVPKEEMTSFRVECMPLKIERVLDYEKENHMISGAYFVGLARTKLQSMVEVQARWMKKPKNSTSGYVGVQQEIMDFLNETIENLNLRFAPRYGMKFASAVRHRKKKIIR